MMPQMIDRRLFAILALALIATCATPVTSTKAQPMTMHARGTFTVKMASLPADAPAGSTHGRLSLDKVYTGDLDATGKGEMIAIRPDAQGSGVYMAIERVSGVMNGKRGAFSLAHLGVMNRGTPDLSIDIVPDSGDGDLAGIAGKLTLTIANGVHAYDIEYTQ